MTVNPRAGKVVRVSVDMRSVPEGMARYEANRSATKAGTTHWRVRFTGKRGES